MNLTELAHIIGNGKSRENFDISLLKNKGTVFGCNALYRDYYREYDLPDYLVAIDDAIIAEIEGSYFPSTRVLIPPEEERWEPVELFWGLSGKKDWIDQRPRSNAGMNAILEAIKLGYRELYIYGFDFLVIDKNFALLNMYEDTECYGSDTKATITDTRNRMNFLGWVMEHYNNVIFNLCYPQTIIDQGVYKPEINNCNIISLERIEKWMDL
jgi:hypothetical protein